MQKRTKIQWLFYFKKNILFEYPKCFSKLKNKKWKQIKKNVWKHYQKDSFKYKSPLRIKTQLKKRRQYFNFYLKEKQFFKIYYNIPSEKQFKNILRQSFQKK